MATKKPKKKRVKTGETITISVQNRVIRYYLGTQEISGDIVLKEGKSIDYRCNDPFLFYLKGYTPTLIVGRALVPCTPQQTRESPFDGIPGENNPFVFITAQRNGRLKLKVKNGARKGIYRYGTAVATSDELVTN